MDYRVYNAVDRFVARHPWLGHAFADLEKVSIPLLVVATLALWLLARPGTRRWKLVCVSALGAAGVALLVNRAIAAIWSRPRPYAGHPDAQVFVARSHDPSFPSDHSSAAFAIAFAVLAYDRLVGALFLVAAGLVAWGRVMVGAHYPGDVVAGALVGLAAALVVTRIARPLALRIVRLVERATDPLVAPVWQRFARQRPS